MKKRHDPQFGFREMIVPLSVLCRVQEAYSAYAEERTDQERRDPNRTPYAKRLIANCH
jgi:hypothetical protein